jgi:hypothetical protein
MNDAASTSPSEALKWWLGAGARASRPAQALVMQDMAHSVRGRTNVIRESIEMKPRGSFDVDIFPR